MNLNDVRTELGTALATISGLNTFPFYVDRVTPPAAVVAWPDPYSYDSTFGRGSDTATFPVVVLVGKVDAESAAAELGAYCDGSGDRSVKAVIEAHTPTAYDSARVESVEFAVVTSAGVEYLSATFNVHVIGNGGA